MAEGWGNHFSGDRVEIHSAGIEAHGLSARAVAAMKEAGVDISHHASKSIDAELLNRADYVIMPPHATRLHWGFADPARATGTEEEVQAKFREVRDAMRDKIEDFLKELDSSH